MSRLLLFNRFIAKRAAAVIGTKGYSFPGRMLPLLGIMGLLIIVAVCQWLLAISCPAGGMQPQDHSLALLRDQALHLEQARGKLLYCAAVALLVFTLLWNTALSGLVILQERQGNVRLTPEYVILYAGVLVIIECVYLFAGTPLNLGGWYENNLLDSLAAFERIPLDRLVTVVDAATAVAILLILLSLGYLIEDVEADDIGRLSRRIYLFKLSIYSAGISLGAGVFELYALYSWAATYTPHALQGASIAFSTSMTTATGLLFTALMIIMYLPVAYSLNRALVIRYQAKLNRTRVQSGQGMVNWAKDQGVSSIPLSVFGSYVAILVPFVTGILTKALQISG